MKGQKGLTLLEVVMAVALFGIIAAGLFMALNVSHKTTALTNRLTIAESLSRSALEVIKQCEYDATNNPPLYQDPVDHSIICSANITIPDGYDVVVTAERLDPEEDGTGNDDGIQKVTVEVKFEGDLVVSTDAYKVNRE